MTKKIFTITIAFVIFSIAACQELPSLRLAEMTPTPTLTSTPTFTAAPTLTITPTLTIAPSPTSTHIVVSRVIPTNYYRISKTKFTIFINGEAKSVCIQTNTHKASKIISDDMIEIAASSEYQPVVGDCFGSQPKQWIYQVNVYTGEFLKTVQKGMDSSTTYFGKNYRNRKDDVFSLSGVPIPVWRTTFPIERKDILDKIVVYEGAEENLIDKATGLLIYQIQSLKYIPDPTATFVLEMVELKTNAPIGGIADGAEFMYSKEP